MKMSVNNTGIIQAIIHMSMNNTGIGHIFDKSLQSPPFPRHTQTIDTLTERLTHYTHVQTHICI